MTVEWKAQLTYPPTLLNQPIIYWLGHDFDVVTTILEAQVNAEGGCLTLIVRGDCDRVQQSLAWAAEQGVLVDVLSKREEPTCGS